ncbi:MAG: hypothetical protein K0S61_760 [Anaerocolumna sp.]|jgi:beta-lactamase regulating signal transducer with metallopeptidase domain|nr:hypothetical protein [Anaerocolumna sp.]
MDAIFLQVLNMSLTASYVIIIVIIVRLCLKKVSKIYSLALWSAVLFRLICPLSFEGVFSLVTINANAIPQNIMYAKVPQISTGINIIDSIANPVLATHKVTSYTSINPMQITILIGEFIWVLGGSLLLIYSIISLIALKRKLVGAVKWRNNLHLADHITTPFVMGIIHPKIYLPSTLSEREQEYIVKHEQTHIRRLDHIIKMIAFLVLIIHWFNPLVWLAFILYVQDMEMSCDESVINQMGMEIRSEYAASLLSLATGRKIVSGIPLAFGEGDTKNRIKNVLDYKKLSFGIILVAAIGVIGVCVGLILNPMSDAITKLDKEVYLADIEQMNIGAEMPYLLYGDDNIAIMQGTFGLLIYNLNESKVTNRISYDQLKDLGITMVYAGVSLDGAMIYFGNDDMMSTDIRYTYQYDIKSNTFKEFAKQEVEVMKINQISTSEDGKYYEYYDFHYLINNTVVELDKSFIYLRAKTDWSMKSLQIVISSYEDGTSKIYDVFK